MARVARNVVGPLNGLVVVVVSIEDGVDRFHRLVSTLVDGLRLGVFGLNLPGLQLGGLELVVFCDKIGVLRGETHARLISPEDDRVPSRLHAELLFSMANGCDIVACAKTNGKSIHRRQGRSKE